MPSQNEDFLFDATDGYRLSGRYYRSVDALGIIIIAGATGVPQEFYRRFSEFATGRNYDVVTFDYRGIGRSAPANLKGFTANFQDWAQKDLQALIAKFSEQSLPLYLVGHSFGGHAVGLLNNHHQLRAACFLGTGAGWHGWMPFYEQLRVLLLWNLIAPLLTHHLGYLALSKLGMGEDLPIGVYQQWKRWCKYPHYFFDDPSYPLMAESFGRVQLPLLAFNSVDDKWAPPVSRDAFMQYYRNSIRTARNITPETLGIDSVGHMGYFREKTKMIWSDIIDFFDGFSL